MLVNRLNFNDAVSQLRTEIIAEKFVACDTETTALFWWRSPHYAFTPRVFSVQFSTASSDYYFDFGCEETLGKDAANLGEALPEVLFEEHFALLQHEIFSIPDAVWFIHNAKFDLHHLANHGIEIAGKVHCTQSIQRLVNNLEPAKGFSLDSLSEKYLGANKIDLAEYWKDARRITKIKKPGDNAAVYDFLHFDRLPLFVLYDYGKRDTRLCYRLGLWQLARLAESERRYFSKGKSSFGRSLTDVYEAECALTKNLMAIERTGIQLDMPFVKQAHQHAMQGVKDTLAELDTIAKPYQISIGKPQEFMDWNSGPSLKKLFDFLGLPYAYTEKGNATFDKDGLKKCGELGEKILTFRRHSKRAHTYLENYLWLADTDGVLHCNFAQGGTETGRLSCREPNMQNVPKRADKKEADFVLRKCFIPRAGKVLVSMDLDQAEYRIMMDYAGEEKLIRRVLDEGLNVHEATNQEMGLGDYDAAKTMNFRILYGAGVAATTYSLFSKEITISEDQLKALMNTTRYRSLFIKKPDEWAKFQSQLAGLSPEVIAKHVEILKRGEALREKYFSKLPKVQEFIKRVREKAKKEGYIFTWAGRVLRYDEKNEWGGSDDYKAPNGLCQGGIGDLGKAQLNLVVPWLRDVSKGKSAVVLHVHDEVLAEIDESQLDLIPDVVKMLGRAYPFRHIPITAGAAMSRKSWGDLEDIEVG